MKTRINETLTAERVSPNILQITKERSDKTTARANLYVWSRADVEELRSHILVVQAEQWEEKERKTLFGKLKLGVRKFLRMLALRKKEF